MDSRRRRGCLIVALVVVACGAAAIVRTGYGFIQMARRVPQIGREVRSRLAPGLPFRDALALAYAAGRNEPVTSIGNPVAFVWARCTSSEGSGKHASHEGFPDGTRVYLFLAREGPDVPPVPAGGLPARVSVDQPGANLTDSKIAVDRLGQCPQVEIVFESGFFGWVHLPLKLTPEGRIESVGEIEASAK